MGGVSINIAFFLRRSAILCTFCTFATVPGSRLVKLNPLTNKNRMSSLLTSRWLPLVLLTCSNVFMTFAWYGHLKFKNRPLWVVTLVSWGIAFFEYLLQVPANRWGSNVYSAPQLKIIQEVITLCVFIVFAVYYLDVKIRWNHVCAFLCILAAVAFTFLPKN